MDNIVNKPWGYEYIAYQNDIVALKVLHIRKGECTSLHCHPTKSTGLVVVGGQAMIRFIADQTTLTAPAKKMIRRGLFHQTQAITDVVMLEIETPIDQDDLIRLQDEYGRENKGYETSTISNNDCLILEEPNTGVSKYQLGTSTLTIDRGESFSSLRDSDIVIFLKGGLVKTINGRKHMVTCSGDVGEYKIVSQVAAEMDGFSEDTVLLYVSKMTRPFPPEFESDERNISIDFDGVIHSFDKGYHDGTCYGDPIPGSLEAVRELSKQYRIIIFTVKAKPSRPLVNGKTGTELVWEWLKKYGIADCVSGVTSEKPHSFLYIDDNGYRFENWNDTLKYVKNTKGF